MEKLRKDKKFSTRLPFAKNVLENQKISMTITKFYVKEEMINQLQSLKCETHLSFHQNLSGYCDRINYMRRIETFQTEEDPLLKELKV